MGMGRTCSEERNSNNAEKSGRGAFGWQTNTAATTAGTFMSRPRHVVKMFDKFTSGSFNQLGSSLSWFFMLATEVFSMEFPMFQ